MTWLSTWLIRGPGDTRPQYAAHDSEAAAEAHAAELLASKRAKAATVFEVLAEESA